MIDTKAAKGPVIDAIRVTSDNINDVAEWCEGAVLLDDDDQPHIVIPASSTNNPFARKANVGDWVLSRQSSPFKVYSDAGFYNHLLPNLESHPDGLGCVKINIMTTV